MTSLPVKDIGAVMTRSTSSGTIPGNQSTNAVSFESVWNNQTEKNSTPEPAAEQVKTVRKEDDITVRDSLKAKDSHKNVVNQNETVEEAPADDLRNMDPEEWERAMEVLGAAAAEMIQEIANAFDMTVEEVQGLLNDLGMEQLDVLQQETLSQLILAAGGAEDATSLLTDEELYQQFQNLMTQMSNLVKEAGESLQLDAEQLVQIATEVADDTISDVLPIEITVEDEMTAEDGKKVDGEGNIAEEAVPEQNTGKKVTTNAEESSGNQMQRHGGEQNEVPQGVAENKGQGENLILQNLKAQSFEPQMQQVSQTVSTWDADTIDIMKQIMDYMRIQVKPDMSNLEMQLHPESLGTLQIHVAAKGGNITAQFVTQNEAVKAALESQMIQLKENFAEQGVKVDAIEVTVQTHQFEQNLEQGRGRQQEEPGRRNRPRRIQLDGALNLEDLSALEEEEQLTAEMMAANGNTVDYTA